MIASRIEDASCCLRLIVLLYTFIHSWESSLNLAFIGFQSFKYCLLAIHLIWSRCVLMLKKFVHGLISKCLRCCISREHTSINKNILYQKYLLEAVVILYMGYFVIRKISLSRYIKELDYSQYKYSKWNINAVVI